MSYEGDSRRMVVDALADPWTSQELDLPGVRWVHVAPLARSDFGPDTLAALAHGRRLSLDGQGLVRPARTGLLELDADYDPEMLRPVSILKLAEEAAALLVDGLDERALRRLACPRCWSRSARRDASSSRTGSPSSCAPGGSTPSRPEPATRSRPPTSPPAPVATLHRGRATRRRSRRRPARRTGRVIAHVQTADGLAVVDLDEEVVLELDPAREAEAAPQPQLSLPLVVAAAASGSTIVAVLDTKPPLVVSHDSGRTWRESGRGLPPGRAVAISSDDPDVVVYATRNRLYLSRDGGRFWQSLSPELPEIQAVSI